MNDNIVFTVEPEDEPVVMHISEVEVKKGPRGDDGFSPVIETEQLENGYKVTITDAEGPHEFFIYNGQNGKDGTKGDKGDTGNGISRVELNNDYTLTFYFTDADSWTTPISIRGRSGADGKDGTNGEDGFSPTIEITSIENGRHIVITDKTGPHSFDIFNGHNGEDGPAGKDGKDGLNGTTFTPHVSSEGDLSWSNADGKVNPETINIKGPEGKSAYESAVEAGFEGTEEEFNEYLSGIDELTNEVADQKSAIEDLEALTNRKAGMLVDTAAGAVASFTPDATIENLLGVSVAIEPVQAGSGDPSPANVRPISGWDSVNIWNKPTHDATLPPTVEIQLGQTVYGGTLDVDAGTLTVDTIKAIADGTIAPTSSTAHSAQFSRRFPVAAGYTLAATALKCNRLRPSNYSSANDNLIFFSNANIMTMRVSAEVTDWVIWLRDNPVEFSYKIANPITIQLDPVTISTISGQTNNVWADAGDVDVTFAADVKTYIDQKIAAAVAALS